MKTEVATEMKKVNLKRQLRMLIQERESWLKTTVSTMLWMERK